MRKMTKMETSLRWAAASPSLHAAALIAASVPVAQEAMIMEDEEDEGDRERRVGS